MKDKIRVTSPADLIAYVCHSVGFVPTESVAILAMVGNQLRGCVRFDLPGVFNFRALEKIAEALRSGDAEIDSSVVVIFATKDDVHLETTIMEAAMTMIGADTKDVLHVTDTQWRSVYEAERHPVSEITEGLLNAELILNGSVVANSAAPQVAGFTGDQEAAMTELDALAEATRVTVPLNTDAADLVAARMLWQATLRERGTGSNNAQMIAYLHNTIIRDWTLADCVQTTNDPELLAKALMGEMEERPDWERVTAAEETLHALLAQAPGHYRAPLLTMLGWIHFLKGHSTWTQAYLELALAEAPSYTLAHLFMQLIGQGHIAGVAKNPKLAFQG